MIYFSAVKCADPNEEYINAIFSEMTCSDQVQRSISPVRECRCKPGYLRDSGKCILPSTCREGTLEPFS